MKIAQISGTVPPSKDGVADNAIKLNKLLVKLGHFSKIYTTANQKKDDDVCPFVSDWTFTQIIKLIFNLKKENYDLIIFQYPTILYGRKLFVTLIPFLIRLSGLQTISIIHEYFSYSIIGKIRIFPIPFFSNYLITSDKLNLKELKKIPFVKRKICQLNLANNFLDDEVRNVKKTKSFNKEKIRVVYFGLIRENKGLEEFLDFLKTYNDNVFEFNFIGGVPEKPGNKTIEILQEIKNNKSINYLGYLEPEQLLERFTEFDLVILPYKDGVTLRRGSMLFALSYGKPVITTMGKEKINGLVDENNIFYLKGLNLSDFNEIFTKIKHNFKTKLEDVGNNGQKWYELNCSDEIILTKINSILKGEL